MNGMILTVQAPFVCVPIRPGDDVAQLTAAVAAEHPDHPATNGASDCVVTAVTAPGPLNAAWVAFAPDGQIIGHVGVRFNDTADDGTRAPTGRTIEVSRLMVHPHHRRLRVASALMQTVLDHAPAERLWLTTVEESPAHRMYRANGWLETASVTFTDDPRPGVLLTLGRPHGRTTP